MLLFTWEKIEACWEVSVVYLSVAPLTSVSMMRREAVARVSISDLTWSYFLLRIGILLFHERLS